MVAIMQTAASVLDYRQPFTGQRIAPKDVDIVSDADNPRQQPHNHTPACSKGNRK